ncbi:acetyl-CoA C-acetyltransferase [Parasphingorhabdus sp.]|uniref:acetyl-CoA C-acetyltransferase n=1 Tax=Parasphingorhabdus sp. TaxID=2709688 RepID=UPI003001A178
MTEAYIIDAVRTPRGIGKPGKGALSHLHPQHLAATVLKALKERNNLDTASVDDIIWSTSTQKGKQGGDMGRMAALAAGYDTKASGTTLDRFCGGGITSVNFATATVMSGMEDCVIAGGTEMMSYTTQVGAEEADAGITPLGMGSGNPALDAIHPQSHQGVCGDAIAAQEGISREAVDALALESQKRAAHAIAEGRFAKSLITVYNEDGSVALDHEEFPRPQTTAEGLAGLKASFAALKDFDLGNGVTFAKQIQRVYPDLEWEGVHHAGNSSGVVDGAAALLITSKDYADKHGLKPRARIISMAAIGSEPTIMLTGPEFAAKKALERAGMTASDIDLWELNEAFAAVVLRFMDAMNVDHSVMNVNGGAIAMGHPLGATGAMILGTALDELERSGKSTALATLCIGGGMGIATIIERVN